MICHHRGMTFICYNEIRDVTAEWLNQTCHDVAVEPPLQPLTGENIFQPVLTELVLIYMLIRSFWGRRQSAFFDVRVFHPNARSYHDCSISAVYRHHKMMIEFGRLSWPHSLPWFFRLQEAWVRKELYSIVSWQIVWPVSIVVHIVPPCPGSGVCLLFSVVVRYYVYTGQQIYLF